MPGQNEQWGREAGEQDDGNVVEGEAEAAGPVEPNGCPLPERRTGPDVEDAPLLFGANRREHMTGPKEQQRCDRHSSARDQQCARERGRA